MVQPFGSPKNLPFQAPDPDRVHTFPSAILHLNTIRRPQIDFDFKVRYKKSLTNDYIRRGTISRETFSPKQTLKSRSPSPDKRLSDITEKDFKKQSNFKKRQSQKGLDLGIPLVTRESVLERAMPFRLANKYEPATEAQNKKANLEYKAWSTQLGPPSRNREILTGRRLTFYRPREIVPIFEYEFGGPSVVTNVSKYNLKKFILTISQASQSLSPVGKAQRQAARQAKRTEENSRLYETGDEHTFSKRAKSAKRRPNVKQ